MRRRKIPNRGVKKSERNTEKNVGARSILRMRPRTLSNHGVQHIFGRFLLISRYAVVTSHYVLCSCLAVTSGKAMQTIAQGNPKMMRQASMLLTDAAAHNKDMSHCHAKDKDAHFLVLRYANIWKPPFMHLFSYTQTHRVIRWFIRAY